MLKTIFLDRDGIINDVVMRGSIVSSPRTIEEFRIREDFRLFYECISRRQYDLFVISNQPDVSRNLLSDEALGHMDDMLRSHFTITEIVYCRHDDVHACPCRKPKPGMISQLLHKYGLEGNEAIIIGDSYKDILAGKAAGIRTIYYRQGYNSTISCEPDFVVDSLTEALELPVFATLS